MTHILQERAKVIVDLMEKGASYVEITDTGIRVSRKDYEQMIGKGESQPGQIIQLINTMSTNINVDSSAMVSQILDGIRSSERDADRLRQAEENLGMLLEETHKKKPKWQNVKRVLEWALHFGKDIFIQLVPVLLRMSKDL